MPVDKRPPRLAHRPACGSASTRADNAPDAVRRLVGLARQLLGGGSDEQPRNVDARPPTVDESRLERIARLRDELSATANRVGAFWMIRRVIRDGWTLENAEEEARKIGLRNETLLAFAKDYISRHAKN